MRIRVGFFVCLASIGVSTAFATEPQAMPAGPADPAAAPAAPSESTPAATTGDPQQKTSSDAKGSAPAPAGAVTGTQPPATAQAAPTAATKSGNSELTAEERQLVNQGYKVKVRNGEKYFCRGETELGSRLAAHQTCGTLAQLKFVIQQNKDEVRAMQFKSDQPSN